MYLSILTIHNLTSFIIRNSPIHPHLPSFIARQQPSIISLLLYPLSLPIDLLYLTILFLYPSPFMSLIRLCSPSFISRSRSFHSHPIIPYIQLYSYPSPSPFTSPSFFHFSISLPFIFFPS